MATVRDIFEEFCEDVLEPNGLVLGIATEAQFLETLGQAVLDFLQQTGMIRQIYTQTLFAGQGQYAVPDQLIEIRDVFLAGCYLPEATVPQLNNTVRNWRRVQDYPLYWHKDHLPIKTIELAPTPIFSGEYIEGADEPDPPHAQYGEFSAIVNGVLTAPDIHRGLTIVASQKSDVEFSDLDDEIPLIPDQVAKAYMIFGVSERFYNGDNELKDLQKAAYCHSQWLEGINMVKATLAYLGDVFA